VDRRYHRGPEITFIVRWLAALLFALTAGAVTAAV